MFHTLEQICEVQLFLTPQSQIESIKTSILLYQQLLTGDKIQYIFITQSVPHWNALDKNSEILTMGTEVIIRMSHQVCSQPFISHCLCVCWLRSHYKRIAESFSVLFGSRFLVKKISIAIIIYLVAVNVLQMHMRHRFMHIRPYHIHTTFWTIW